MNYTKIPNGLIRLKISSNAKLILFYILSKKETFKFFNYKIIQELGTNERTFYKAIQELIDLNLLEKTKVSQKVNGKLQNLIDYQRGIFLYNYNFDSNFTKIPDSFFDLDLNSTEKIVYAYILSNSKNYNYYNSGIANDLNLSKATIERSLSTLINKSLINRHGTKITALQAKQEATTAKIETKTKPEKAKNDVKTDSNAKKCLHYANLIKQQHSDLNEELNDVGIFINDTSYSGLNKLLAKLRKSNFEFNDDTFSTFVNKAMQFNYFNYSCPENTVFKFVWFEAMTDIILPQMEKKILK